MLRGSRTPCCVYPHPTCARMTAGNQDSRLLLPTLQPALGKPARIIYPSVPSFCVSGAGGTSLFLVPSFSLITSKGEGEPCLLDMALEGPEHLCPGGGYGVGVPRGDPVPARGRGCQRRDPGAVGSLPRPRSPPHITPASPPVRTALFQDSRLSKHPPSFSPSQ